MIAMHTNRQLSLKFGAIALMILLAAFSRVIPHPYNFTPIGAMALFGAAYFTPRWMAFAIPMLAMWLSDLVLNNLVYASFYPEYYSGFVWIVNGWVYLSFAIINLAGFTILQKITPVRLLSASLGASVLFFIITNFGAWLSSPAYSKDVVGLISSYAAGIPFFGNTIAGDLCYTALLFGIYEWMKRKNPVWQLQR